jgi:hypothetical protein
MLNVSQEQLFARMNKIDEVIRNPNQLGINSFRRFTGMKKPLGDSLMHNSALSIGQILFSLALSEHKVLQDLIDSGKRTTFDPKKLVENQVLSGMKILDMGCGYIPSFARCARFFGAEVYTVDSTYGRFAIKDPEFPLKMREEELTKHQLHTLNRSDSVDILKESTGGEFDIVTACYLALGMGQGFHGGKDIGLQLLKPSGWYYEVGSGEIITREPMV